MPVRYSALRCTNSSKEGYCCTTFAQDPNSRQKWIDAIGILDWNLQNQLYCTRLVSKHTNVL